MPTIVVAGSFDTKREPLSYLIERVTAAGGSAIVIDTSVFASSASVDFSSDAVAAEVGASHAELPTLGRAVAIHVMADGAARIVGRLWTEGRVDAVVCLGGSNAATVFSKITEALPTGVPKILMSTVVAGDTRPMINARDAVMMYPIVDIEGRNRVLDAMIDRLADVAVASASTPRLDSAKTASRPTVGISMFGVTTPAVSACRALLEAQGDEVLAFHANGAGGRSIEKFVEEGLLSAVLDLTTTELADELFGGMFPAGPERLTTAARRGIPQVLSIGALDMINFGPLHTVPEAMRHRKLLPHNDIVTLVRTSPPENEQIGRTMAERLGRCSAPTAIVIPLKGVSELDKPGGPFYEPESTAAFLRGLRSRLDPSVRVIEADLHINDQEFAKLLVDQLTACRVESVHETRH